MPGRNRFALLEVQQAERGRSYYMSQTKQASKRKRKALSVSVLSVAGMSLAANTGSQAGMPSPGTAPVQAFLGEEEISDISLATFHLAGQENPGAPRSLLHLTRGGCGCGHGCGGCGHGCGGSGHGSRIRPRMRFRRIGCGCRGCGRGCGCVGFWMCRISAWVGGAEAAAGAAGSADGRLALTDAASGSRCSAGARSAFKPLCSDLLGAGMSPSLARKGRRTAL